jgi:hypothetical protein
MRLDFVSRAIDTRNFTANFYLSGSHLGIRMENFDQDGLYSISRLTAKLEIQGQGTIEYELVRHLASLTISKVFNALPITDTVHFYDDKFAYMHTKLQVGAEKPRTTFKSGEIAFLTNSSSVCFFLQECRVSPMNLMGVAKTSIDMLRDCRAGTNLILKK